MNELIEIKLFPMPAQEKFKKDAAFKNPSLFFTPNTARR